MSYFKQVTEVSSKKKFFINLDNLLSIQTVIEGEAQFTILTFAEDYQKNIVVCETAEQILGF